MVAAERGAAVRDDAGGLEFEELPGGFDGPARGDLGACCCGQGREAERAEGFGVAAEKR